jgi:tetratricopeptide (TPR) repeat protein
MSKEVEDLLSKCIEFRQGGRLDEAILAARRAASIDPDSANAYWQLGLCIAKKNGEEEAIEHFEKTVELSEEFSYGWWRLGAAYKEANRVDDAIEAWERSVESDEDPQETRYSLIDAYIEKGLVDYKDEALLHLIELEKQDSLRVYDQYVLGWIKHTKHDYFGAIKNYSEYLKSEDSENAYTNLAAVFASSEINRRLDAVDCLHKALRLEPASDRAKKLLNGLEPRLHKTKAALSTYLNRNELLQRANWYQAYISPIQLLQLETESNFGVDVKVFQRAKKILLQEIDLEDGCVSWLKNVIIDKSRAIRVSDELIHPRQGDYHRTVFSCPPLLSFLSTGSLELFLYDANALPLEVLEMREIDEDFSVWLSTIFRKQYEVVFPIALQAKNINLVEALLDGRRFMTPADEDSCFASSLRVASEFLSPLRDLSQLVESEKPSYEEMNRLLGKDGPLRILQMLPAQFREIHTDAAQLIRGVAVDIYNKHGDADLSKTVLTFAEVFAKKSPALLIQHEKDKVKLDEVIKEERKDESYLTFGDKPFRITRQGVTHGTSFIKAEDAETLRWGITITNDSGRKTYNFRIVVGGHGSSKIDVLWKTSKDVKEQEELFRKCVDAIFAYIFPVVHSRLLTKLGQRSVYIGGIPVTKQGVTLKVSGWFTEKEEFFSWTNLKVEVINGDLVISSRNNSKAAASLSLVEVDNAWVLLMIAKNGVS